jgi:hypothetical protein
LKKLVACLTLLLCALAPGAHAAEFGANDDTGKYLGAASGPYYEAMAALGLRSNVIALKWEPSLPDAIPERLVLDPALARAEAAGVRVVLALYPARPTVFTKEGATPAAFAEWAALVARTYPQVRRFVVGNEPNQPRFWRPQFRPRGGQASAAAFGPMLAAAYDALKAVDPELAVAGIGLSPRGNDRPDARDNVSTSPVRFLKALGDWYRRSRRGRPLMDSLAFHPYPASNRDRPDRGYVWPNAGVADLGRIKQAVWDAFHGTAQPTTANGLTLDVDEVGWQVDTSLDAAYAGAENVAVTDERTQARFYGSLVRLLGCDPSVAAVNLFGFRDEPERTGWQAGVMRYDGTLRPAAGALQIALTETGGGCLGALTGWRVAKGVIGADVEFRGLARPRRVGARVPAFTVTAREEARFTAAVFPVGTHSSRIARELAARRSAVAAVRGTARASRIGRVEPTGRLRRPGRYVVAVRLAAWANPGRSTLRVSRPFRVTASPRRGG